MYLRSDVVKACSIASALPPCAIWRCLRDGQDLADFMKFQSFVVAQDDDFAVMGCEFEQRVAHQFARSGCLQVDQEPAFRGNEIGLSVAHLVQRVE